ncbi:hypothetical protein SEA_TEACUP_23 [Arthrobacter phage Teacup]|uniref:Minor tail protein n=1 Tax=Arthrobacter phage Teacup TaxID=2015871 RepID=A0A222ZI58_9CAUD|nr:hypothetical protein QCN31_gp23 [Arthrobacter phage Teacup]ASR84029.1 hypothetical protein SEA_TEACUP_23 [Arthrobacter phage Teacup]
MAQTPDDPTKAQVWITKGIDDLDFEFYFPQGPKGDPGPFVPVSVLGSSGTNLNELVTPGIYSVAIPTLSNDSVLQNYPFHEAGSMWVTTSNAGSVVVQQYMTNTKGMYVRRRFNGTWSAWRFFGHSRTDQSAGRAMYQWDEINQREQLVYGDTGLRNITDLATMVAGSLSVRRIGQLVTIHGTSVQEASTVTGVRILLPAGNLPGMYPPITVRTIAYAFDGTSYMCEVMTSGEIRLYTTLATIPTHNFSISYGTNSTWPTTLIGTTTTTPPAV